MQSTQPLFPEHCLYAVMTVVKIVTKSKKGSCYERYQYFETHCCGPSAQQTVTQELTFLIPLTKRPSKLACKLAENKLKSLCSLSLQKCTLYAEGSRRGPETELNSSQRFHHTLCSRTSMTVPLARLLQ